ncbi:OprD family porin [Denitrificimonas sp. JX-1]|uniref:OprD family porin n=1 Tax=Denitrificimonas halotolerans TaxID=3098930 RepID=A0ABU5GU82_9GAMM|nr:OprD family porin [Denitrificimonas sp. JX-1]MDY7219193.1 OprD family porin [Denitrificimonas sp. JX-1]
MIFSPLARAITLATASSILVAVPSIASAAFVEDSTATLGLRNLYMNQDTRNQNDKTKEEWSQAFILDYKSGFTEGTIGIGVDLYGAAAMKLDSGPNRTPDSFPQRSNGKSVDDFGKIGATFKAKLSETVLELGTLKPRLPMLQANLEGRILPQLFTGGMLTSNEINGLTATLGHIDRVNQRASTNRERMRMNSLGKGLDFKEGADKTSNSFDLASVNYKWNDSLATGYNFGRLEDLYKQHIVTAVHTLPLGEQRSLKTDLRISRSTDDGKTNVDNKAFSGMVTYNFGYNKLGLGYQKMTGDTGYAYIQGSDPFLVNYVANREFGAKDEKSWQIRHDYNFAGLGIPGLTMFNRYVKGTGADIGQGVEGREWERDFDISYAFQTGALKNLHVRWRNSTVRSNINKDLDDNRLIIGYTLPLL